VESLVVSYGMGTPINELAKDFEIHRSTVLDHLNRSPARRRYPALDSHGVEVAERLYRAGLSLREVGAALSVHASSVRQALIRAGVPTRDAHGREP